MAPQRGRRNSVAMDRALDPDKVEEDKNKVRDYVKEDLFERVVFVWSKAAFTKDGILHKDFMKNCRSKIADGSLVDASDEDADAYMNFLWNGMVKENCYREWLSHKRSSRYQAVQDKFMSKCAVCETPIAFLMFYATHLSFVACFILDRDVQGM